MLFRSGGIFSPEEYCFGNAGGNRVCGFGVPDWRRCARCMCGAVSGAVICLGYVFGRVQPTTPADPKSLKTLELAYELQDSFKKNHKVLCCKVLLKNVEENSAGHVEQCAGFIGEMASLTAGLIARELNIKVSDRVAVGVAE